MESTTQTIQRQYDDVIAKNYDHDPQGITRDSLRRAVTHVEATGLFDNLNGEPLTALDLGMGTGLFYELLAQASERPLAPFGVDLSPGMLEKAKLKLPELNYEVDDAANFDSHFAGTNFDLISTHFVTGFVPVEVLAPLIFKRLKPGGYWSFVGSSKASYPELRRRADSRILRMLFKGASLDLDELLCPKDERFLHTLLADTGFEVPLSDTFEPELNFPDFDAFMAFAYHGGWLTPFIEQLGLQNAGKSLRLILNKFVFPVRDHHSILFGLARKPSSSDSVASE